MRRAAALVLVPLIVLGVGCQERSRERAPAPSATPAAPRISDEYPRARWRLATFEELNRTVIWVSQIAVRHAESQPGAFRPASWEPDPSPPQRSTIEALRLAEDLARRAGANPDDFARLARQYSDDVVSRERGGSLGGVRASQLPQEMLDALTTLKPGQVSRAFRTPFGFHVVKRHHPPSPQMVSGRRLAVGYYGTVGRPVGRSVERTRDEARALASRLFEQAKAQPRQFPNLIERYSDTADAAQQGDMGVWSTLDPEFFPEQVERLAELRVGEFSVPLDTRFGFEILQRTAVSERPAYAMTAIELKFDLGLPATDPRSQSSIAALAERLAREVRQGRSRFEDLQSTYCCDKIWRWTEGRGPVGITEHLRRLRVGEVSSNPIPYDWFFVIPKRLDPAKLPPAPPVSYELPSPERPDFAALLEFNDGRNIAAMARDLANAANGTLKWETQDVQVLANSLERLAIALESDEVDSVTGRADRIQATRAALRSQLGDVRFREFESFAVDWAINLILR